ncbi:DUF2716 domain-containing protein [Ohtaekwangia kribbensis]|jgi:hypothetical protein|uniref:DUF2716 domain-containing protein n=1 Tax=Ohtaekwangia kribbensis TaxID=688913 RepID=A0ABW3JZU4_9BACT
MKIWAALSEEECNDVWEKLHLHYNFPAINTDKPILTFSIQDVWENDYFREDLERKALDILISITRPGEKLLALDWEHTCYRVDLRLHKENPHAENIFHIPFIPDGDYYIFVTEDFENVWFGHPWKETITVIGEKLAAAVNKNLPEVFKQF